MSALMQPLLRHLALRVQDAHELEGPVFWRPYGCRPCLDPSHARNAIVYTHLNPVRARIVEAPSAYPWTSHALYTTSLPNDVPPQIEPLRDVLDPALALGLFATASDRTNEERRTDYREFVDWRIEMDRAQAPDDADDPTWVPQPPSRWRIPGARWALSPLFHSPVRSNANAPEGFERPLAQRPDLASLAQVVVDAEAPGVPLERIRGRGGGAQAVRVRHAIIRRLHAAGFRNVRIARFLRLSESAISYVLRKRRNTEVFPGERHG